MTPKPSKLEPRLVPSTEWVRYGGPGFQTETGRGGVYVEANVDTTCFSLREISSSGDEDVIHFCDWPELRATIDQFMTDREKEADE